ncbi:DUF1206 domain-containing protein [Nocardioides ferulae]|uniref:DUF1206 domain-containing protein n=1 Tax=Nocardioides ferulae TaxID=2340821 RepID=UPI000EB4D19C|nr:DUF1206 domain-containing protein [Nocardioides ferulae]
MGVMTHRAEQAGSQAHESDWLDHAIRVGLVAYGLVHLIVGWIALQLALGDQSGSASSSGAMQQLVQEPFGEVLVWLVVVGMVFLVAWRLLEASVGHRDEDGSGRTLKRAASAVKAVIYGVIGWSAFQVVTGSSGGGGSGKGGSGGGTDSMTATVMGWPGGQLLVGAAGLAVIGYGLHHVWRAWTEKFREKLTAEGSSGNTGAAYVWFGKVGYAAKGVAVGIVGGLFVYAAATHDAKKSGGLDQALHEVLEQPFGSVLLGAMALGIICYGLFSFAQARHLSR